MKLSEKLLTDRRVLDKYEAIDKVNPYPLSHGMKHIHNTVALVDKLAPLFDLSERETEILKICEIMHDLGQVDGRENHGLKTSIFARDLLSKTQGEEGGNDLSQKEIDEICSAIATHDEKEDYSKLENKFSYLVNFIDKMDFSKNRLEDDSFERFGYLVYDDIDRLDFEKKGNEFYIKIVSVSKPKIISETNLFARDFFNKVVKTAKMFCKHFNLKLKIYLDDKELDIGLFNENLVK